MFLGMIKDALVTRVLNAVAAGTSEQDGTALDMQGYDSVVFVALLNTVVDNCVLGLAVKSNPTSSNSGGTVETGTQASRTAASDSNKTLVSECFRPSQRYVYAALTRTTQNATIDGIVAIQFNSKNLPVTQPTGDYTAFGGPNA